MNLSKQISSLRQTLSKNKRRTIRESQEEYIESLKKIIGSQRKRIRQLETGQSRRFSASFMSRAEDQQVRRLEKKLETALNRFEELRSLALGLAD